MIEAGYGSWDSPITAALLTDAGVALGGAFPTGVGVYWAEGRPSEGGRVALVYRPNGGAVRDVTPQGFNARTRMHEYGGGSIGIDPRPDGDVIVAADFTDQRVYRLDTDGPTPITPEPDIPGGARYANFTFHGDLIVCAREMHRPDAEPDNDLVVFPIDGSAEPMSIASGHDFYSSPTISPDGTQIAWLVWDHPQMPWDGTQLVTATISSDGTLSGERVVAGSANESIFQPAWSPDGELHFVSDRSGWWNLYRLDATDGPTLVVGGEFELGRPQWVFGTSTYGFFDDGRIAMIRDQDGWSALGVFDGDTFELLDLDLNDLSGTIAVHGDTVWLNGRSSTAPTAIVSVDVGTSVASVEKQSMSVELDAALFSSAEAITFPTTGGAVAHAFYYPPHNPEFTAPADDRPPLVVMSHGGPTSAATGGLKLSIQYWTTRGFAVVDVNYRGSTGYGRDYRNALRSEWGVADTDDCIAAARFLADRGDADPDRMAIRGGSAGGYTTLCALAFHDTFAAGASYFGVADVMALVEHTHKFESRYIDSMIGPLPEAADLYRERSPVFHTEQLSAPMLILQGLDDKVVPPDQAEAMVAALKDRGIPHAYLAFEGEGHGFRDAQNQVTATESELSFYGWAFGFKPAGDVTPVTIER